MALKESGGRRFAPAAWSLFKPMAGIPVQQFLLLGFRVRALGKCSAHSSEPFEIKCLVAAGRGQHTGAALTARPLPSIPLVHTHARPGGQLPAAFPFCDLLPDVQRLRADTHPADGEGPQFGGSALVEREQLIGNRPVVAVLASCVQTRVRRGSLPLSLEPSTALTCAALFGCMGNTGSNALPVLQQSEPQFGQTRYQAV